MGPRRRLCDQNRNRKQKWDVSGRHFEFCFRRMFGRVVPKYLHQIWYDGRKLAFIGHRNLRNLFSINFYAVILKMLKMQYLRQALPDIDEIRCICARVHGRSCDCETGTARTNELSATTILNLISRQHIKINLHQPHPRITQFFKNLVCNRGTLLLYTFAILRRFVV